MTTLLFLALHAARDLNSPYDSYALCVFVGLDAIAAAEWLRLWLWLARRR